MKTEENKTSFRVHNVRFYDPQPRAIYCMAMRIFDKKLAISRSDASIEIWNLQNTFFIEKIITPSVENFSIEGLCWFNKRLFSVGLHGLLVEYDTVKLNIKNKLAVTGEAAYCLDISPVKSTICIGTEQGYINLFKIENEEVLFEKFFDKQEGRIICIKFDHTGQFVVSGGLDAIRIWDAQTGHALHRMTTGRSIQNKPTIVWCLQVTKDFQILSGDSRGKLTFWDGKQGSQIKSYQSHRADILSICMSEDETTIYFGGVDPVIVSYVRIDIKNGVKEWVKHVQRKIHEHDVRAMTLLDNKLFSGGIDGYLAYSSYPPKTLVKSPPLLHNSSAEVAKKARLILLKYPQHVELWSLGSSKPLNNYKGLLQLEESPRKLLELYRSNRDYNGEVVKESLILSSLSPNGKWILLSSQSGIRLFKVEIADDKVSLEKVEDLEGSDVPCFQAAFSPDSSQLITAPNTGSLVCYQLNKLICTKIKSSEFSETIVKLEVSPCGRYLAAADANSSISVWSLSKGSWNFYVKLPKYGSAVVAVSMSPINANLVVVYADNKIVEYDLKKKQFSAFSKFLEKHVPVHWKNRLNPTRGILFDSTNEQIIILHDDSSLNIINKDKGVPEIAAKIPKVEAGSFDEEVFDKSGFYSVKKYKHLVHLDWISKEELVAVEVNPLKLLEQLPPAFKQNTFGTK